MRDALANDTTTPMTYDTLTSAFKESVSGLISVVELNALLKEFDNYTANIYTEDSFQAYQTEIDNGKQLLVNGTAEQIQQSIEAIETAKQNLATMEDAWNAILEDASNINANDYTEESYQKLQDALNAASTITTPTRDEYAFHTAAITDAKKALVSIIALNEKLKEVSNLKADDYTQASFAPIQKALETSEELKRSGTKETISAWIEALDKAMQELKLSGKAAWSAYTKDLLLEEPSDYIEETYIPYQKAYEALMELEGKDMTMEEFTQAKIAFEEAKEACKLKAADYTKLNELIQSIPKDLTAYDQKLVRSMHAFIAKIDYKKNIREQAVVDQYYNDLEKLLKDVLHSTKTEAAEDKKEDNSSTNKEVSSVLKSTSTSMIFNKDDQPNDSLMPGASMPIALHPADNKNDTVYFCVVMLMVIAGCAFYLKRRKEME